MSDFIDRFEAQLVATAPRPLAWHVRARRWIAAHAVVSVLVAGAVTATTTAAAVATLHGSASHPMAAALTKTNAHGVVIADGRYAIQVSPSPEVGAPGWCEMVYVVRADPRDRASGGSCGVNRPTRAQHIGADSFDGAGDLSFAFFMVDDDVAGIRLRNGHVVLARTDPSLPPGWRAVVVFSGDPGVGRFTNRALADWRLLDAHGVVIGRGDEQERVDDAAGPRRQPYTSVDGPFPAGAACHIDPPSGGALGRPTSLSVYPRWGLRPVDDVNGDPPLACASTMFGDVNRLQLTMHATVFVDTHAPGIARPARFAGLAGPDDGRVAQVTQWASGPMTFGILRKAPVATAVRRGAAWLVVDGGTPAQQRELIGRLRVTVRPGANTGDAAPIALRQGKATDARMKHFH